MSQEMWDKTHVSYERQDWIDKPSIFVESVLQYFPGAGTVLDLGAGHGQDSRYLAENGYHLVSTDFSDIALQFSRSKTQSHLKGQIEIFKVDLAEKLQFDHDEFEVIYAHLSLHYFDQATTARIFDDIFRILKVGGVVALLVNSIHDPEYGSETRLGEDYYLINQALNATSVQFR